MKRNPLIAAILTIAAPGLGYVYNGKILSGVIVYFLFVLYYTFMMFLNLVYKQILFLFKVHLMMFKIIFLNQYILLVFNLYSINLFLHLLIFLIIQQMIY